MSDVELTDAMLRYVWDKLDALEPGEKLVIKNEAPNRPDMFVECAKKYLQCFNTIDFNKNYTKVRRLADLIA